MFGLNTRKLNWNQPSSISQLDEILGSGKPFVIFKHSERCSISRFAMKQFENEYESDVANLIYIEVREHRDLSNYVAEKFNITHQSPQVIVQNEKESVFSTSHDKISAHEIITFLSV